MRSKSVFVSQPSPLNPFPPFSAGTDASAPESGFVKTGYEFLSVETLLGAEAEGAAVPVLPAGGGVDPPPQAAVITITPTSPANELCSRLTSPSQRSILLRDQRLQRHGHDHTRADLFNNLERFVSSIAGVQVRLREMDPDKPGEFDAADSALAEIRVDPFRPKPVSRFRPVRIEKQEVLQERD